MKIQHFTELLAEMMERGHLLPKKMDKTITTMTRVTSGGGTNSTRSPEG